MTNSKAAFKVERLQDLAQQLKEFAQTRRESAEVLSNEMKAKFIGNAEGYEAAAKWIEGILEAQF